VTYNGGYYVLVTYNGGYYVLVTYNGGYYILVTYNGGYYVLVTYNWGYYVLVTYTQQTLAQQTVQFLSTKQHRTAASTNHAAQNHSYSAVSLLVSYFLA